MKATVKLIEELFDEWNEKAFDNSLARPRFRISASKRTLGTYQWKTTCGNTISISGLFDFSIEAIRDVLIHEMIHYYVRVNYPRRDWNHGWRFQSIMNRINRDYGTKIQVKGVGQDYEYISKRKERYVFAVESPVHGNGFAVVSPTHRWTFMNEMKNWKDIEKIKLFVTDDPYFDQFAVRRKCSYSLRKDYTSKLRDLEEEESKKDTLLKNHWVLCMRAHM